MLTLLAVSLLSAQPTMYVFEELGEIEYRVPYEGPIDPAKYGGVVINVFALSDGTHSVSGFEDRHTLAGLGADSDEVPKDIKPSTRITAPVITREVKSGTVKVRFPSQWFAELKGDTRIVIKGDKAVITVTEEVKHVTQLNVDVK
jgi:hypothetical protein